MTSLKLGMTGFGEDKMRVSIEITPRQYQSVTIWLDYQRRTNPNFRQDLTVREAIKAILENDLDDHTKKLYSWRKSLDINSSNDITKLIMK